MLSYSKVCNLKDFRDTHFSSLLRSIFGRRETPGDNWPIGQEDRKFWEVGMAVRAANELLSPKARRLAVGVAAGTEATNFILTRLFDQVIATDRYGADANWAQEAPGSMLVDPGSFAGTIPYVPSALCVRRMDARRLELESESCDFVYSSSSIEHMGSDDDIKSAVREMARILRPGGILSLSTEFAITPTYTHLDPGTRLFLPASIHSLIVVASGCEPVDRPKFHLSRKTIETVVPQREAERDLKLFSNRFQSRWSSYPHLVLSLRDCLWTSVHLALRKPIRSQA